MESWCHVAPRVHSKRCLLQPPYHACHMAQLNSHLNPHNASIVQCPLINGKQLCTTNNRLPDKVVRYFSEKLHMRRSDIRRAQVRRAAQQAVLHAVAAAVHPWAQLGWGHLAGQHIH